MFKKFFLTLMVIGLVAVSNFFSHRALATTGEYTGISFDTAGSGNANPLGIVFYNNFFWITDTTDDEVYKYNPDGTYTGVSFDTAGSGNGAPSGIATYNDFFWITDTSDDEVYKYNPDGTYASVSFDLGASGNGNAFGITAYDDFFWITDNVDIRIYKYGPDGTYTGESFLTVASGNSSPYGIVAFDDFFWVTDFAGEVYKHDTDVVYAGFSFDTVASGNSFPSSIAVYNDFFWVVDVIDAEVYKYGAVDDVTSPILSETTPVTTPTTDTTPDYTFTTDEAGDITYGGSCTSVTTEAVVGANTITFNALILGTYTDCTITVTDDADNDSDLLAVTSFTITVEEVPTTTSSGSTRRVMRTPQNNPLIPPSTDTDGCTFSTAYSPKTGAKCPEALTPTPEFLFLNNLRVKMIHPDIKELQKYLNQNGFLLATYGPGSPRHETEKFGNFTVAALIRFQVANNIPPSPGTLGPITRALINSRLAN